MVTELSLSPTSSAAEAGCYTSPELLPPLATVREESGSLSSSMKEAVSGASASAPPAIPEEPDAADMAAGNQACISQFDDSAGELLSCSDRPHSFIASPFAHPHHNCSSPLHTPAPPSASSAAAGSSSSNVPNAPKAGVLPVPHQQFRSFAVAESEPSDGAKRLVLYDSSQVVLVHTQCLMRSREAQHLVRPPAQLGRMTTACFICACCSRRSAWCMMWLILLLALAQQQGATAQTGGMGA